MIVAGTRQSGAKNGNKTMIKDGINNVCMLKEMISSRGKKLMI